MQVRDQSSNVLLTSASPTWIKIINEDKQITVESYTGTLVVKDVDGAVLWSADAKQDEASVTAKLAQLSAEVNGLRTKLASKEIELRERTNVMLTDSIAAGDMLDAVGVKRVSGMTVTDALKKLGELAKANVPSNVDLNAVNAVTKSGFRIGPTVHGEMTIWCSECDRDGGYHFNTCKKYGTNLLNMSDDSELQKKYINLERACEKAGAVLGGDLVENIWRIPELLAKRLVDYRDALAAEKALSDGHNEEVRKLNELVNQIRREKNDGYNERNQLVALAMAMAKGLDMNVGMSKHEPKPGEDWDKEWLNVAYIDLPTGQASWHVHNDNMPWFEWFPKYNGKWDGHTTLDKYKSCYDAITGSYLYKLEDVFFPKKGETWMYSRCPNREYVIQNDYVPGDKDHVETPAAALWEGKGGMHDAMIHRANRREWRHIINRKPVSFQQADGRTRRVDFHSLVHEALVRAGWSGDRVSSDETALTFLNAAVDELLKLRRARKDLTLRELQTNQPWTIHYHRDFRSSPMAHKDFGHALLHVNKAVGKLAAIVNDAEHGGSEFKPHEVDHYIADLVVCAIRMANTVPGRVVDLQRAVEFRIESKNGVSLEALRK